MRLSQDVRVGAVILTDARMAAFGMVRPFCWVEEPHCRHGWQVHDGRYSDFRLHRRILDGGFVEDTGSRWINDGDGGPWDHRKCRHALRIRPSQLGRLAASPRDHLLFTFQGTIRSLSF
jgi:hypothetical protein